MPTSQPIRSQNTPAPVGGSVRERIVAGARSHFFAHGFRGVTMDDLARELGMSKKTLYAHFSSKTALLETVVTDKLQRADAALQQVMSGDLSDFVATMRELLARLQEQLQEIQPPFVRDMRRDAPDLFRSVQSRRRELIERHFGRILNEGRRKGAIRKDIPNRLMIEILLGTVDSIMNPTKIVELKLTPKTAFSTILAIFFHGVMIERNQPKP